MVFPYVPNYGGNWQTGAGGGTPITEAALDNLETQFASVLALLTTRGDIIYRGAATWERLAKGTQNYFLKQGANDPFWAVMVQATREFFVPVTYASNVGITLRGYFAVADCANGDYGLVNFYVPHDFTTITEAVAVLIPKDTNATANIDINSIYAANGEAYNTHSEAEAAATYAITTNQIYDLDISGILSALAAGDYVGIRVLSGAADSEFYLVGIRFKYT